MHGPCQTKHRLFIANCEISPSENYKQFTIGPKIGPVVPICMSALEND